MRIKRESKNFFLGASFEADAGILLSHPFHPSLPLLPLPLPLSLFYLPFFSLPSLRPSLLLSLLSLLPLASVTGLETNF